MKKKVWVVAGIAVVGAGLWMARDQSQNKVGKGSVP
jgi:hypothetical protein